MTKLMFPVKTTSTGQRPVYWPRLAATRIGPKGSAKAAGARLSKAGIANRNAWVRMAAPWSCWSGGVNILFRLPCANLSGGRTAGRFRIRLAGDAGLRYRDAMTDLATLDLLLRAATVALAAAPALSRPRCPPRGALALYAASVSPRP